MVQVLYAFQHLITLHKLVQWNSLSEFKPCLRSVFNLILLVKVFEGFSSVCDHSFLNCQLHVFLIELSV